MSAVVCSVMESPQYQHYTCLLAPECGDRFKKAAAPPSLSPSPPARKPGQNTSLLYFIYTARFELFTAILIFGPF